MSKSKEKPTPQDEPKYATALLIKSKALAGYQPDFARVILKKEAYTITEAKAALDAALKKGAN